MQMPTTIEELEAAIQDNISQANSILFLNPNIVAEYENRQREAIFALRFFHSVVYKCICWQKFLQIGKIASKLEVEKRELNRCVAEVDALKVGHSPFLSFLDSTFFWDLVCN